MMETAEVFAPYLNSRVAGMRSKLFSKQHLEDLLNLYDVTKIIDDLMESAYQQEMAEALTRHAGVDAVEDALTRGLVNSWHALSRLCAGPLQELVDRFLMRWDLSCVKALLRMRHHGIDAQTGLDLLAPGPNLTVPLMKSFAEHGSMEELVSALAAWKPDLCGALTSVIADYRQQQNDLSILEDALDRGYFVRNVVQLRPAEDEDSRMLRKLLRMEIDRINVRILLQLRNGHASPDQLAARLLPSGWLNEKLLREMAGARDAMHAMEFLAPTPYKELAEDLIAFVQAARFSPMDRHFDKLIIKHLRHESHAHVMSFAAVMHFAWAKYNEVVNVRLIARGAAAKLPLGKVREETMHV